MRSKPIRGRLANKLHPLTPTAAWIMNEGSGNKIYDIIGKNYGTLHNSPSWIGEGIDFETSSDQYIELDTAISLADDTPWSIAFKFKAESASLEGLYGYLFTSGNYTRCLYHSGDFRVYNDGNVSATWTWFPTVEVEYDIAIVCNGLNSSNTELFVDGVSQGVVSLTDSSQNIKRLASYGSTTSGCFDGVMNYFYVYDGIALQPSKISQLYINPYCWLAHPEDLASLYISIGQEYTESVIINLQSKYNQLSTEECQLLKILETLDKKEV